MHKKLDTTLVIMVINLKNKFIQMNDLCSKYIFIMDHLIQNTCFFEKFKTSQEYSNEDDILHVYY